MSRSPTTSSTEVAVSGKAPDWTTPYQSTHGLAIAVAILVGIATAVLVLRMLLHHELSRIVGRVEAGLSVRISEIDVSLARQETIASVWTFAFIAAGIAFLLWFYRVYANLPSLGARSLRFGRGWAFWGWVVPIMNIWRPKQIINDVWRASDPGLPPTTASWSERVAPGYWTLWWVGFLLGTGPGSYLVPGEESLAAIREALTVEIATGAIGILAGVLAIPIVLTTSARQGERAHRLRASGIDHLGSAEHAEEEASGPSASLEEHETGRISFSGSVLFEGCDHRKEVEDLVILPRVGEWQFCPRCRTGRRILTVDATVGRRPGVFEG